MAKSKRRRRIQIVMDEDAWLLLQRLTTPRRKGEYLSELVRRAAAEQEAQQPGGIGLLQRIAESLARIEGKLDGPAAEPQTPG